MQKIYLLAALSIFLFRPNTTQAQATQHAFFTQVESSAPDPNGAIDLLLSGVDAVFGLPRIGVQRIWPDGQLSHHWLLAQGIPLGLDILPTADSGYLVAASFFQCDIEVNWKFYRFDATGNLLWEKDPGFDSSPHDVLKLLPGPGNTFWLFRNGSVPLHYTDSGDLLESGPLVLPVFRGHRKTPDNRYLAYGPAGLALYAPNLLSYQFALPHTPLFDAAVLPGGRFAALSADSVFVLDASFNTEKTTAHGLPENSAPSLVYAGGALHLLAGAAPRQLIRLDTANLHVLDIIPVPAAAPFQPRFLQTTLSGALLLAAEEQRAGSKQVVEVRTVPADTTPYFGATADAALGNLIVPYPPAGSVSGIPAPAFTIQVDSVDIWLKNNGTALLQTVTLNSVLNSFSWFCGIEFNSFRQTYSGLNLAPGDSVLLHAGALQWGAPGFLPPYVTLCFWTTLPNDSLDANPDNNQSCRTFPVIVPTFVPDPAVRPLVFAPNPAAGATAMCWENADTAPAHICVYNANGALQTELKVSGGHWTMPRGNWPAGLYTVLIRNENGKLFAGRLVWR
ncbi:MAG: T9SS type A sorting domain-containing protein [Saprospirales bacterium]|jgi:hypothetical protein|nr:T9SS type A sorting domain-containing protein [Saprospirales bacterium]